MSTMRKLALAFILIVTIVGCAPTPTSQAAPTSLPQSAQPLLPQQIQIVQAEKRSISVVGKSEIKVEPDMVQFAIGVETENRLIMEAKSKNDEITQKVLAVLEKYEIDKLDIKTNYLSIYPQRDYSSLTIKGYSASHSIQVIVRDLTKFESLLIEILEAGATRISGINFQVSDMQKYEEQARAVAIRAAKEKAIAMAKELGQEIGDPLTIQEAIAKDNNSLGNYLLLDAAFISPSQVLDTTNNLALGQLTITAVVTVEFALK